MRKIRVDFAPHFIYELDEEDEEQFITDDRTWTDKEILDWFIERAAEDFLEEVSNHPEDRQVLFDWFRDAMTARFVDEDS